MNILILTYQGDMAGSTFSIAYLAEELAKRGNSIFVGLRENSLLYTLLEGKGIERISMNFNSRFDRTNIRHIRDIVRKNDIEIINAQSSLDRYTSMIAVKLYRLPCKVVHTRRQEPKSIGGIQNVLYRWGTDKFVVISNELKRSFIKKGFPEDHLHVIHNGLPKSRYEEWSPERVDQLKRNLQINDEDTVIGCVSRLKNQIQILEALKYIKVKNPVLIFCGIEETELDISDIDTNHCRIIFQGQVPKEEILNYYKLFDMNILASTMDGFGLVLVEAMAMECPVIATNFGGIKDVVKDRENGLLFTDNNIEELASCINTVASNSEIRAKLIDNGKSTAFEEFTMEKTAQRYEEFFKSLL